jgi:hypothetical protein
LQAKASVLQAIQQDGIERRKVKGKHPKTPIFHKGADPREISLKTTPQMGICRDGIRKEASLDQEKGIYLAFHIIDLSVNEIPSLKCGPP